MQRVEPVQRIGHEDRACGNGIVGVPQAIGPDSANPIAYPRNVTAFAARIVSAFALVAALTWIVFPAVVFASTSTSHVEGDACPCCDGAAALGTIIACPGCQAAAPADIGVSTPYRTFSAVWLGAPGATFAGIDPVPAEPPPR